MKPTVYLIVVFLALLVTSSSFCEISDFAYAHTKQADLQLSMPIEYINYTIIDVDGMPYAKVDGYCPINIQNLPANTVLPVAYPMPANASNIRVSTLTKLSFNGITFRKQLA